MNITTKNPNLARKLELYNSSFEAIFKNYGLKGGFTTLFYTTLLPFCVCCSESVVKRYTKLHFLHKIEHFFHSYTYLRGRPQRGEGFFQKRTFADVGWGNADVRKILGIFHIIRLKS